MGAMVQRASSRASPQALETSHTRIATRALGAPTLYFGNIPISVRVYAAVQASYQEFRWISPEGNPIKLRYLDNQSGNQVCRSELQKAIEVSKDKFLVLSKKEWEQVSGNKRNMIELREAIAYRELSPFSIDSHYFLSPAKKSHKAYRLLQRLLYTSKRALLGKWYLPSGRDRFVMVSAMGQALLLARLHYSHELRSLPLTFAPDSIPSPQEVRLASDLLDRMTPPQVSLLDYQDEWAARLSALVEKKPNLTALLEDSLRKAKRRKRRK